MNWTTSLQTKAKQGATKTKGNPIQGLSKAQNGQRHNSLSPKYPEESQRLKGRESVTLLQACIVLVGPAPLGRPKGNPSEAPRQRGRGQLQQVWTNLGIK